MFRSIAILAVGASLLAGCGNAPLESSGRTDSVVTASSTKTEPGTTEAPASTPAPVGPMLPKSPSGPQRGSWLSLEGGNGHLHQVRSMLFRASFNDGAAHEVAVEFRAPGGFMYQRWTGSVVAGQAEVEFHLPVAGSSIDLDNMQGSWEALVWVDGVATASHDVELKS